MIEILFFPLKTVDQIVKIMTLIVGGVIEGFAAIIVGYGIIKAMIIYIRNSISNKADDLNIRLGLGKMLALSLEFLLAADIVRTAVAPTWDDIGKLAAVATLRTLLNYFLERELHKNNPV